MWPSAKWLLLPIVFPIGYLIAWHFHIISGHGEGIDLLSTLFLINFVGASSWLVVTLPMAYASLKKTESPSDPVNLLAISIGAIYVVGVIFTIVILLTYGVPQV